MSTKIFNLKNQKLSADKLREVLLFNSNNYGGIIAETSPISISGSTASLIAPVTFLCGGALINQTSDVSYTFNSSNELWYLEVSLNTTYANITTDELLDASNVSYIGFKSAVCQTLIEDKTYTYYTVVFEAEGNPSTNEYYEYSDGTYSLSSDTSVDDSKVYYKKLELSSFHFKANSISTKTFTYIGTTLWISDTTFIVPICANINNSIKSLVSVKSVKDFEGLLNAEYYAQLKKYCEDTFVWTVGGQDEVVTSDGTVHKKGDIGNLNITDNVISNNTNNPVTISRLAVTNLSGSTNTDVDKIAVNTDGSMYLIQNYKLPVSQGGTYNASNWDDTKPRYSAKKNLGIFYGTSDPTNIFPFNPVMEGDIYLKIIE